MGVEEYECLSLQEQKVGSLISQVSYATYATIRALTTPRLSTTKIECKEITKVLFRIKIKGRCFHEIKMQEIK